MSNHMTKADELRALAERVEALSDITCPRKTKSGRAPVRDHRAVLLDALAGDATREK